VSDYQVIKSQNIIEYHEHFVRECFQVHDRFKKLFPDKDSTWGYGYYNIFAATSPSPIWYNLYKEVRDLARDFANDERPMWIQAWLNFHNADQVLDWHGHDWPYHGYISIDPKSTTTIFKGVDKRQSPFRDTQDITEVPYEYEIKNEIGNIYIGPGHRQHKVVVDDVYDDSPRITLGFDIQTDPERPFEQWSLLPLL
jgi:hypothetical protein